jgi:hypothetical protein
MPQAVTEREPMKKAAIVPTVAANWTQVLANLVDIGGTTWGGAQIIISFVPAPSIPGPYFLGGDSEFLKIWNVKADGSGYFDIGIPDNTTITPAGSTWQFTIAPAATQPAVIFRLMIAGTGMNISSIFTAQSYQLQQTGVPSLFIPRAYNDNEVIVPPNSGQLYFNSTFNQMRMWIHSQWYPLMGGGVSSVASGTPAANVGMGVYFSADGFPDGPPFSPNTNVSILSFGSMQMSFSDSDPSATVYKRIWQAAPTNAWSAWSAL